MASAIDVEVDATATETDAALGPAPPARGFSARGLAAIGTAALVGALCVALAVSQSAFGFASAALSQPGALASHQTEFATCSNGFEQIESLPVEDNYQCVATCQRTDGCEFSLFAPAPSSIPPLPTEATPAALALKPPDSTPTNLREPVQAGATSLAGLSEDGPDVRNSITMYSYPAGASISTQKACLSEDLGESACRIAVEKLGLAVGSRTEEFAGDYSETGCYAFSSGKNAGTAWYGYADTGGEVNSVDQLTTIPFGAKFRIDTCQACVSEDLSESGCRAAAQQLGLTLGGFGNPFAADYSETGCFTYTRGSYKGMAWYGYTDSGGEVSSVDQWTAVSTKKYRVNTCNPLGRTDSPTTAPTPAPTESPTADPTAAPTAAPTESPTDSPTVHPTATPTAEPTGSPTAAPTTAATAAPTESPTADPTATPTAAPTNSPTADPTATPTAEPTGSPTAAPTTAPTAAPTPAPTTECWEVGQKVKIREDSRYEGQALGSCATVSTQTCPGGGYIETTFDNGYFNWYKYDDLRLCQAADETTSCIPFHDELTTSIIDAYCGSESYEPDRSPTTNGCDAEYTGDVRVSLANKMFHSCWRPCLFQFDNPGSVAYEWVPAERCWQRHNTGGCLKFTIEHRQAIAKAVAFCEEATPAAPAPKPPDSTEATPAAPAPKPPDSTSATDTTSCMPFRHELTTSTMEEYCGSPESYDEDRSPTVNGCDAAYTGDVRLSLANKMFFTCGAWCLFQFDDAANVAYKWNPSKRCWDRTGACLTNNEERTSAEAKAAALCKGSPTAAPTAVTTAVPVGSLTAAPTAAPAAAPTAAFAYSTCYKNDGLDRIGGHIPCTSFEGCASQAACHGKRHFGMENPAGCSTPGQAYCLLLDGPPFMTKVSDTECEVESMDGRPLGGGGHLAVYSNRPPAATETTSCTPFHNELTTSIMEEYCGSPESYDEDRSPTVNGCDAEYTGDVRVSLANNMFVSCGAWCLFQFDDAANVAYNWNPSKQCWDRTGACLTDNAEHKSAIAKAATLCKDAMPAAPAPKPPDPTGSPTAAPTAAPTAVATASCTPFHNELTTSVMEEYCESPESYDEDRSPTVNGCDAAYTGDVRLSLANNMFFTCAAWCLFQFDDAVNVAYKWNPSKRCWDRNGACLRDNAEHKSAITKAAALCKAATHTAPAPKPPDPTGSPTAAPTAAPIAAPTASCTPFHNELTTSIMEEYCGSPESYDEDRSPTVNGCDAEYTGDVRVSLANNMFVNCGAWCLFHFDDAANVAYNWNPSKRCWDRTGACLRDNAEHKSAITKADALCKVVPQRLLSTFPDSGSGTTWPKASLPANGKCVLGRGTCDRELAVNTILTYMEAPTTQGSSAPTEPSPNVASNAAASVECGKSCSNWKDIMLRGVAGVELEECVAMCKATSDCAAYSHQLGECEAGLAANYCYIFGPGCQEEDNACWTLFRPR